MNNIFREYLISKEIRIVDKFEENRLSLDNVSQFQVETHMQALYEFHKRAAGYCGYSRERISTGIGKNVEKYKVDVKKGARELKDLEINDNNMKKFFIECIESNIKRAEKCLKLIYESGYIDLIMRSMKAKEICIGNSSFKNIRFKDTVEVISIKDCSFNMVENDAVYLMRKIKRKGCKIDYVRATEEFCKLEKLDEKSRIYILALLSYPYEFMKYYGRFREDNSKLSITEWKRKIGKALIMDGKSFI